MAKFLEFSRKAGEFIPKIGGTLGTIAGAVGIAKAGGIAAKGIRGLLGIGEKLGTPSNPMITKDVNDDGDGDGDLAGEVGDAVKDGIGSLLKKRQKSPRRWCSWFDERYNIKKRFTWWPRRLA